jgi:hypothetical protein
MAETTVLERDGKTPVLGPDERAALELQLDPVLGELVLGAGAAEELEEDGFGSR